MPEDGRLANYEKILQPLIEAKDDDKILDFALNIFSDCKTYLESSFNLAVPTVTLQLMGHRDYNVLCDEQDSIHGKIPRHNAITIFRWGYPPTVCVNFQMMYFLVTKGKIIDFLVHLIANYMEELIHCVDVSKSETEIHQITCDAIETFAEVKLTDEIKEYRLNYSKEVDSNRKFHGKKI